MNFQEIEKLFADKPELDAYLVLRHSRQIPTYNIRDVHLLDITGLNVLGGSLQEAPVQVTQDGTAFATDANGSPVVS